MDELKTLLQSLGFACSDVSPTEAMEHKAASYNAEEGKLTGLDCPICKNKGIVMKVAERNGTPELVTADCKCMETRWALRRMQESGLLDALKSHTFATFQAPEEWSRRMKLTAMSYAKSPVGWFFVGGQTGCGKTHICTAICAELLNHGKAVKYMLWRDDAVRLKALVKDSTAYAQAIQPYKDAEVLYIDDLFKTGKTQDSQSPTAGDQNIAFEILNYRYNDPNKLTIISSECTMSEIIAIDEAIAGRIFGRASNPISIKRDFAKNFRFRGGTVL